MDDISQFINDYNRVRDLEEREGWSGIREYLGVGIRTPRELFKDEDKAEEIGLFASLVRMLKKFDIDYLEKRFDYLDKRKTLLAKAEFTCVQSVIDAREKIVDQMYDFMVVHHIDDDKDRVQNDRFYKND